MRSYNKIPKIVAVITLLVAMNCGDKFLDRLDNFSPNEAPIISSISACYLNGGSCTAVTSDDLIPGNTFRITVVAHEPDDNEMTFTYLADVGSFSSQADTTEGSTAILTLPSVMPAGINIKVSIRVNDPKRAKSLLSLDLGSGKLGLNLTSALAPAAFTNGYITKDTNDGVAANDMYITFTANGSDGLFQTGFVDLEATCVADPDLGYLPFFQGLPKQVYICGSAVSLPGPNNCEYQFPAQNSRKKLCLFVQDSLLQTETISYTLTSDDTDPVLAISPTVNGGLFAAEQSITLTCTDNFECDKICYNTAADVIPPAVNPDPSNPVCDTTGTTVNGASVNFTLGNLGNGKYTVEYYALDKAGRKSTVSPVSNSFEVNDSAPILTVGAQEHDYVGTGGYTSSDFTWQSNINGTYKITIDTACNPPAPPPTPPYYGTAATANSPIVTTLNAAALGVSSSTPKVIRICYATNSDPGVFGQGVTTVILDNTPPSVATIIPVSSSTAVSAFSVITVNLSEPIVPGTVSGNTADTTCSGSIQVSGDDFATCVKLGAAPVANGDNSSFTLQPAGPNYLTPAGTYKVKVSNALRDLANNTFTTSTSAGFATLNDVFLAINRITTTTASGNYGATTNMTISVEFSRNVNVSGPNPTLALDSGGTATYNGVGAGTSVLKFTYTVVSGHNSADLNYTNTSAFNLNGATIVDANDPLVNADTTLPSLLSVNSLGGGKDIVIDTIAPAAPTGLDLDSTVDDTGTSSTDNLTKLTSGLTISGPAGSTEAGATIELFRAGSTTLGTTTAAANGSWIGDISLAEGVHTVTAKATDVTGNLGPASTGLVITIDATAPAAPTGLDLAAFDDTGSSNFDNITNKTSLIISGSGAPANAPIVIYRADTVSLATPTASGSGTFTGNISLSAGVHSITAKTSDVAGNQSVASAALTITVDTTATAPTGLDLAAADDDGFSNTDNFTSRNTGLIILGSTEANASVELFRGGTISLGTTTANGAGSFNRAVSLSSGTRFITAKATDVAGNLGGASAQLILYIDRYGISGIGQNVPASTLYGWMPCFRNRYGQSKSITDIQAACIGADLLMACRPAGNANFTLVAHAPMADVFFDTGINTTTVHNANGVDWYFNLSRSWGFAQAGTGVSKSTCDTASNSPGSRMCWHTGGSSVTSGYRCGTNFLNGNNAWERMAFARSKRISFETGTIADAEFIIAGAGSVGSIDSTVAAVGTKSLKIVKGGTDGHHDGLRLILNGIRPSRVYYRLRVAATTVALGYLVFGNGPVNSTSSAIFAYNNNGTFTTAGASSPTHGAMAANTWYLVDFRNINWTTFTYNVYIGGVLKATGNSFRANDTDITWFDLYNFNAGTSWFDDINIIF